HFGYLRLQQTVHPRGMRPFFEGDTQAARYSAKESENGGSLGHEHRLHHQLAALIQHRRGNACLVNIQTNTLNVTHQGAPFLSSGVFQDHCRLLSKGALLYCVPQQHFSLTNPNSGCPSFLSKGTRCVGSIKESKIKGWGPGIGWNFSREMM